MTAMAGAQLANFRDLIDERWDMATSAADRLGDDPTFTYTNSKRFNRLRDTLTEFACLMCHGDEETEGLDTVVEGLMNTIETRMKEWAITEAEQEAEARHRASVQADRLARLTRKSD